MKLVEKLLKGDRLSLARTISLVENRDDSLRAIMAELYPHSGNAFILGVTGPPGAGKSTVTDRLVGALRAKGQKVAVTCIDPSSPFSGGAILGDRIRMQAHNNDPGVYIRSLGTRGKHGGLSHAARDVVMVLDAAGFDWVIVETAGVGQTELDVLKLAHGVCVVLVPESGDGIQMMKAGLMEIADIFVVNKCDRPEADKVVREIANMVGLGNLQSAWAPPVVKTQALNDIGIDDLMDAIMKYKTFAETSGRLESKRAGFIRDEVLETAVSRVLEHLETKLRSAEGQSLMQQVLDKKLSPIEAAEKIFPSK